VLLQVRGEGAGQFVQLTVGDCLAQVAESRFVGEVRSLAARTSQATVEIVDVVRKNHDLSLSAVSSMQSSLSRTGVGVELANEAGQVILEIQEGSRHVVDAIGQFNSTLQLQ
jgi:methyl-accepting chemotaxis protein